MKRYFLILQALFHRKLQIHKNLLLFDSLDTK